MLIISSNYEGFSGILIHRGVRLGLVLGRGLLGLFIGGKTLGIERDLLNSILDLAELIKREFILGIGIFIIIVGIVMSETFLN